MKQQEKTFEASMLRLEQIVKTMETGDISLEESLKLFQEGTELARTCGKILEDARLQVTTVLAGADGTPVEEEFQDEI